MAPAYAFVTLVTSDGYLPGALAVVAALNEVHSDPGADSQVPFQTVCLVTPETVDVQTIKHLRGAFDVVIGVEVIEHDTAAGLKLLGRPDLHTVLTKLHVLRLTQYSKIIFLDADVLTLRPLSHLFTLPHEFAAVPDVGWPDIFNTGVFVFSPGEDKFQDVMEIVKTKGSWDGGDQGVLNDWRGDDWHRLSFTYNTTPTAAYTYAPAYERFGSQISAIHFIGPNKPWHSIPYRAPGSASEKIPDPSDAPERSYAYSALLDRWFNVYDRHYRKGPVKLERDFEVKRYENAWNEGASVGDISQSSADTSGSALGLEDLKRLAVEGVSVGTIVSGPPGGSVGEYRSLPLEGRVDLMRPKIVQAEPERLSGPEPRRESSRHVRYGDPQVPTFQHAARIETLAASGPSEVHPAPHMEAYSPPPSMPLTQNHTKPPEHQSQTMHEQEPPPVHSHHPHEHQTGTMHQRELPTTHTHQTHEHPPETMHQSEQPPSHTHQPHEHQRQTHYHEEGDHHHHAPPAEPPRPSSPPLLSWNPAVEPPPNVAPPASAFHSDAYFPNVWDISPSAAKFQASVSGDAPTETGSFFQPPPPSHIPQRLVQEGHYANVTGRSDSPTHGSNPTPDRSKVTLVFPWEARPRYAPTRKFPDNEGPPPGTFMSAAEVNEYATQQPPSVTRPDNAAQIQIPSPSAGFPTASGYSNVWDSVPSIQKYAARLVKPAHQPVQQILPDSPRGSRRRSESFRSWVERADASSMDGDDEDEGEDGEGEEPKVSPSDRDQSGKSGRARAGSGARSPKQSKREYRSHGVQTIPKEVRSYGVQVSSSVTGQGEDHAVLKKTSSASTVSSSVKRKAAASPPKIEHIDLPRLTGTTQENRHNQEQMAAASPGLVSQQSFIRPSRSSTTQQTLPSGVLSPRMHETYGYDSPKGQSPQLSPVAAPPSQTAAGFKSATHGVPTVVRLNDPQVPIAIARTSSNDTADSPPTSAGPLSPADVHASLPATSRKRATRSWNPATGVDVFKRGSEEVLARFLRMGSWEDDSSSQRS